MAKANKTAATKVNVTDFINSYVENEEKKADSFQLIELMSKWTGDEPKMWGPTIIGFGNYHYKYTSGHEGNSMLIGFSPRKAAFSLYVTTSSGEDNELLQQLGKFKMGKACVYVKKIDDIDLNVLEIICNETIELLKQNHNT